MKRTRAVREEGTTGKSLEALVRKEMLRSKQTALPQLRRIARELPDQDAYLKDPRFRKIYAGHVSHCQHLAELNLAVPWDVFCPEATVKYKELLPDAVCFYCGGIPNHPDDEFCIRDIDDPTDWRRDRWSRGYERAQSGGRSTAVEESDPFFLRGYAAYKRTHPSGT